jgi:hypothetical protein
MKACDGNGGVFTMASVQAGYGPQFTGGVSPTASSSDLSMYGSTLTPSEPDTYNGKTGNEKKKSSFIGKFLALSATIGVGVGGFLLVRGHFNTKALKALGEQVKEGKLTEHLEFERNPDKKGEITFNKGAEIPKEHKRGIEVYRKRFKSANSAKFEKALKNMELDETTRTQHLKAHAEHHNFITAANPKAFKDTLTKMDDTEFAKIYGPKSDSKINELVAEQAHYHYSFVANTEEYVKLMGELGVPSNEIQTKGLEHAKKHYFFQEKDTKKYKEELGKITDLSEEAIKKEVIDHTYHHKILEPNQEQFIQSLKDADLNLTTEGETKCKIAHTHYHNISKPSEAEYLTSLKNAGLAQDEASLSGYKQQHAIYHKPTWATCETADAIKGITQQEDKDILKQIHQAFHSSGSSTAKFHDTINEIKLPSTIGEGEKQNYIGDWVNIFKRQKEPGV